MKTFVNANTTDTSKNAYLSNFKKSKRILWSGYRKYGY